MINIIMIQALKIIFIKLFKITYYKMELMFQKNGNVKKQMILLVKIKMEIQRPCYKPLINKYQVKVIIIIDII